MCIIRDRNCLPFPSTWVHLRFLVGSVLLICLVYVLFYYVSLRSEFRVVMAVTISAWKRCSVHLYLQLFAGGSMSCLCCLWLFACGGVQHIIVLCLVFLRLVSPMSPVFLDCPFLISPSVFSNVHLQSTKLSTIECGISIYL